MIPFILAAVGGYLIADSMKSKKFAKGGMTEHGLQSGDKIIDTTYYDENTINVINDGKYAAVDLDKGERMEGIYANGGETNQEYNVTIRYPSDNQKSGWASFDHIDIRVTATSRDLARAKALKEFKKLHPNKNGTVGNVNNMKPSDFDSLFNRGVMANGGKVDMPYILWVSKDGEKRKIHSTHKSQNEAEKEMKKLWENSDFKAMGNKLKIEYDKEGLVLGYPESRIMAKGGEIVPYILWVSKDGEYGKRELYGTYKSQRAAEMAMKKVWKTGEYKAIGNKRKSEYEKEGHFYANGGVMSRGGESHSDQMIDIMNRDREMSRRMKFQESTLQEDMEEAKEIFGKYWDTLTEKEKIEATKYLKIKGEVGHFGREDDDVQTFMNDLNYKRGGRTNE